MDIELGSKQMTVVFLGTHGVGKTSIIKRFLYNEYNEEAADTSRITSDVTRYHPNRYRSSLVNENCIIDIHIYDIPHLDNFPKDSLTEWNLFTQQFPYCSLRKASAYVLVYDATKPSTFQYVKHLRDQIQRGGPQSFNRPLHVVGNKQDLVARFRQRSASTGDPANVVKKQWRCRHWECSAKYNWKVMQLFKEIVSSVEGSCCQSAVTSAEVPRGVGNSVHQHLSHLPHLAQLAHLGNLAHLGHLSLPLNTAASNSNSSSSNNNNNNNSNSTDRTVTNNSNASPTNRSGLLRRLLCRVS